MAVASEWTSRALSAVVLMLGPAWAAHYFLGIDAVTMLALVAGMALGITYLLLVTGSLKTRPSKTPQTRSDEKSNHDDDRG